MQRTKQDISALIEKGETFHLECKKAQGGLPSSLWESYSAFCNTDGGVILLGVKEDDDSFSVEGVTEAPGIIKAFWDTVHNREKVSACGLTEKDVRVEDCDGKSVVVINVPRAERRARPVYIGNNVYEGTYRRNGEGDFAVWKKSGFPDPSIGESYDPDRTTVELNLDEAVSGRVKSRVESSVESRVKPDGNQTSGPELTQNQPKTEDGWARSGPEVGQKRDNQLIYLTAAARQVFKAYCEDPLLTQRGMATKIGLSRTTIGIATALLIREGFLRRVGPKKGGHWEIVKSQPPTGGPGS